MGTTNRGMRGVLSLLVLSCSRAWALIDAYVFKAGQFGYHTFRIPAVIQTPTSLLLFAEGRKLSGADEGWNDIVVRRSTTGGATWSAAVVVHGESNATHHVTIGNPAPILGSDGRVWMLFSRNNKQMGVLYSDTDGVTWSAARELTDTLMKPNGWTTIFTGLSAGLTLTTTTGGGDAHRLIVCANHDGPDSTNATRNKGRYSSTIYSDDNGGTWHAGADVSPAGSTECNLAQTADGLYMYSRLWNQATGPLHTYGIAKSTDRGNSFGELEPMGIEWPQPDCEGTLTAPTNGPARGCFFLSAPYGTTRANMTLSQSCGTTAPSVWTQNQVLWAGPSAYSAMSASVNGESLWVAYERGSRSSYETIHLTEVAIAATM